MIRNGKVQQVEKTRRELNRPRAFKKEEILYSEVKLQYGDRLIFFSDGVTQAGLGTPGFPLGWRQNRVEKYIETLMEKDQVLSSWHLTRSLTRQARFHG